MCLGLCNDFSKTTILFSISNHFWYIRHINLPLREVLKQNQGSFSRFYTKVKKKILKACNTRFWSQVLFNNSRTASSWVTYILKYVNTEQYHQESPSLPCHTYRSTVCSTFLKNGPSYKRWDVNLWHQPLQMDGLKQTFKKFLVKDVNLILQSMVTSLLHSSKRKSEYRIILGVRVNAETVVLHSSY